MVVDIINVLGVAVIEAENNPPVRSNGDGVETFQLTFQRVQLKPRQIHVCNRVGSGKPRQNVAKLAHVFSVHVARVVILMKALQSFVPID
jgi:hypothetical protein